MYACVVGFWSGEPMGKCVETCKWEFDFFYLFIYFFVDKINVWMYMKKIELLILYCHVSLATLVIIIKWGNMRLFYKGMEGIDKYV